MKDGYIESFDKTKLYYKENYVENPKAAILIVHGLCEHQGRYDYLTKRLNDENISVLRFDHRGHGRSTEYTKPGYLESYEEMIDDVNYFVDKLIKDNSKVPCFLLGHSMGGFAVSLFGAKYKDKDLKGIITSGALTFGHNDLFASLPKDLDNNTILKNQLGDGVCSVKEVVEDYEKDPLNLKEYTFSIANSLKNGLEWFSKNVFFFDYPVLMLHGEEDALVFYGDTLDFFKNAGSEDKEMKIYGKACHEIYNEFLKDEVIDDTIMWIENRI